MTRRRFAYVLRPTGNLSPGRSGQAGQLRSVHTRIPGATIRGALGAAWWTAADGAYRGPNGQAVFDQLFGQDLRVGQSTPWRDGPDGSPSPLATLVPVSTLVCKYQSQCRTESLERAELAEDLTTSDRDRRRACTSREGQVCECGTCHACDARAEPGRGWRTDSALVTPVTRTELVDEVPRRGQLFTREVVRPVVDRSRVYHAGTLSVSASASPEGIAWLEAPRTLWVGGSRSTMGRCTLEVTEITEIAPSERSLPSGRVAFYLHSPAVLVEADGRASLNLAEQVAHALRAAGAASAQAVRQYLRPTAISTWHGVAGLPKPQDWAVDAGAVALVDGCTPEAVATLLDEGIGLRRTEGFGVLSAESTPEAPVLVIAAASEATPPEPAAAAPPTPDEAPVASPPEPPATSPSVVTVDDPRPSATPDPLALLMTDRTLDQQRDLARKLLPQARQSKRYREHSAAPMLPGHVERALGMPWARELSGPARDLVHTILMADDVADIVQRLENQTWGGQTS